MAAQVLIAHTGQRLQIDVSQLTSLDDFKASVARETSIPVQCIITLTPQGRPLKLQAVRTEKEIYVYDNRLAQALSQAASHAPKTGLPIPERYVVSEPPNSIENTKSIQAWHELFKTRWAWAQELAVDCRQMAVAAEERYSEMDVMLRCLDAAVTNLESVIKGLEPKYAELRRWLPEAQADYGALTTKWEQYLLLARNIPASPAMVRFMTGRDVSDGKGRAQRQASLEDLVDLETARKAGRLAPASLRKFNNRIADLDKVATRLFQDAEDLFREYERTVERSAMTHRGESEQLFHDIEALARKINTDYQTALGFASSSRDSIPQVSKIAANHTERLLPSLAKRALEMDDMVHYATQARNSLAAESLEFMRSITGITALSHSVKSQISGVNQEDELATFDYLRLIQQVPYMYASFVAEAIKRRDWFDKMRQDSTTLANEMALFQEEEVKRRRRWYKSIGNTYGPESPGLDNNVPGLEVNLLGEDERWPAMTRGDLEDFEVLLQTNNADAEIIEDVGKMLAEMNNPTKQQSRRMKAFKNGSVHEAALGRSGLLIRGDNDLLRSLQDDKTKLESKLKTAESRVRRLEDLLHRQSQASRPSLANLFQTPSQQLSDRADSTISVKIPQTSEGDCGGPAEAIDGLTSRIQQLELDLSAEKERSASLEKALGEQTTLHNDVKGQMDEANSTKKDLLQNLEALEREFMEERKSLEDEIRRLQARLDDTEDEIEHFGESRENEKASYNETIQTLKLEVERLTREKRDETLDLEGKINALHEETCVQRDTIGTQERQLRAARDDSSSLSEKLAELSEAADMQLAALRGLWKQFSSEATPRDFADLVDGISVGASEAVARAQSLTSDISLLQSQLEASQNTITAAKADREALAQRLLDEETGSMELREALGEQSAKVLALEGELVDGRQQLNELRTSLADGETGSGSLRKRLEEGEKKITLVTEELAARQSQVGSLQEEIQHFKERFQRSQATLSELSALVGCRSEHARDLTRRLYSQNERLAHLLERLGFSVTRQGPSMSIQKIPRSERSSQSASDPDPSSSLRRSGTLNSRASIFSNADLDLLNWADCDDVDTESQKFNAYIASMGSFDMDAFSEAVYRRVKDVEHLARKLQRDARAYREKAHGLQKEAHEKIAYKHFKEGDLALFLPTRNQTTGAWAAFNVGFPHYFLREQEGHRLRSREWLVARISRVQERVVDLSKSLQSSSGIGRKGGTSDSGLPNDDENDNPFDLSDGLRWYLIDAVEDKPGAPSTPGLAKSTVAANNVEAMADRHNHARTGAKGAGPGGRGGVASGIEGVSKTLSKSLESRRSSTGSKKALPFTIGAARGRESAAASETNSLRAAAADTPGPTSPTHQEAAVQGVTQHDAHPSMAAVASGSAGGVAGAGHGQTPPQPRPEVRGDLDSLLGP